MTTHYVTPKKMTKLVTYIHIHTRIYIFFYLRVLENKLENDSV